MNTVRQMQETSAIIVYLRREEGDERRDKRRCNSFHKEGSHCSIYCGKCIGSAHCPYYKEKCSLSRSNKSNSKSNSTDSIRRIFPYRSRVNHKKFGGGVVAGYQKGLLVIAFGNKKKSFNAEYCLERGLLRRA